MTQPMPRGHRVAGALIGSAVGDALGAPFEFGPPGRFSARFPSPSPARGLATEMCGGGSLDREPGEFTDDTARRISALIHGDPATGEGCPVFRELVRVALDGRDPLAAVPAALELLAPEHRARWATVLAPDRSPDRATEGNGAVFGIAGIPMRWTSVVHGRIPGCPDRLWQLAHLHHLAAILDGSPERPYEAVETRGLEPREVAEGVWAADLDGARHSSTDFAVVSLCRTGTRFPHDVQRFAYLTDDDANSELDAVLADVLDDIEALRADGRPVLVHCFAGQSRTGLVLRAWLRRGEGLSAAAATDVVGCRWPH